MSAHVLLKHGVQAPGLGDFTDNSIACPRFGKAIIYLSMATIGSWWSQWEAMTIACCCYWWQRGMIWCFVGDSHNVMTLIIPVHQFWICCNWHISYPKNIIVEFSLQSQLKLCKIKEKMWLDNFHSKEVGEPQWTCFCTFDVGDDH
jgi:hypothetical protein